MARNGTFFIFEKETDDPWVPFATNYDSVKHIVEFSPNLHDGAHFHIGAEDVSRFAAEANQKAIWPR
eukprot:13527665-Alexandrium_andersonii.AAC.1